MCPMPGLVALCDLDRRARWSGPAAGARGAMLHRGGRSCSTRRSGSISSRSARSPSRIASWSIWRRGTGSHILCQKPAALAASGFHRDDRRLRVGGRPADDPRELAVPPVVSRPACADRLGSDRPADPPADRASRHAGRAPGGFADQPYLATMPRLILMDMGCHLVDTARYLMGEIQTVSATIGRFGRGQCRRRRGDAGGLVRGRCPRMARL